MTSCLTAIVCCFSRMLGVWVASNLIFMSGKITWGRAKIQHHLTRLEERILFIQLQHIDISL